MKVLMFGWEFPPHISGGLGTACYGLTKGLSAVNNVDILFVVPKIYGDEEKQSVKNLIAAGDILLHDSKSKITKYENQLKYLQVKSKLIPYLDPNEYLKLSKYTNIHTMSYLETNTRGKIQFSGKYGSNLFQEVYDYSLIASQIAGIYDFEIIHAHDWLTYPAGMICKEITGKPLIIHVHATDFDRSGSNINPRVYEIEKAGMQAADKIIAVSNLTRNIIVEKYHVSPEKVVTIHNAVTPIKSELAPYKKTVDDKIVTFLGRITIQKGPSYFIDVANRVLQKMGNVKFVMAGSGDMLKKMIVYASRLKICDKFHFTGFLQGEDVRKMLDISDVYVMPSVSEPFGISPLEAMRSDVPTIISKQSGVAEILDHAIKVDFWDIDAMADAIYALLNYPSLSKTVVKYGKKEVENMKWEDSARRVKQLYEATLACN